MAGGKRRRRSKKSRSALEKEEISALESRLEQEDLSSASFKSFADYPLSKPTQNGLKEAGYVTPTDIQREALVLGLQGKDVLGAAKTGSGKTLAFVIPLLEQLFRSRWSRQDGIAAIVISPTRELAMQTYRCLQKVGKYHDQLTWGLVTGGTTFEGEQALISQTNIIICTPGRLLQHMDETPQFDCVTLQTLVLDEADRILDMGFATDMNAILQNLPKKRQTLLFSATQTKSVKDLARLSLDAPQYVSVYKRTDSATPKQLLQAYVVCPLEKKLDVLFSFIRTHLKCKTIVFVSSCKQVRFLYEAFRRFRPGIPLMPLFGKQKQVKRVAIFNDFSKKQAAVLIATDIAARGLDFPSVDWVVQLDCPEDVDTYIHRVGRTARYNKQGKAMLVLLPSELAILKRLEDKKVELTKTEVNTSKLQAVYGRLEGLCAQDQDLKYLAQKSFVSYLRSVYLQKDKEVFDVTALDTDAYSAALGLPNPPRVRFVKKAALKERHDPHAPLENEVVKPDNKFDRLRQRKFQETAMAAKAKLRMSDDESDDSGDDLLQISSRQRHEEELTEAEIEMGVSKRQRKMMKTKASVAKLAEKLGLVQKSHKLYDDDGGAMDKEDVLAGVDIEDTEQAKALMQEQEASGMFEAASSQLKTSDTVDKLAEKERLRAKKRKRKAQLQQDDQVGMPMQLGASGYDSEEQDDDDGNLSEDEHQTKRRLVNDLESDEAFALKLLGGV